jgi:hypothetical protein
MSTVDERDIDPIHEMTRVSQSFLNLAGWGFIESYRSDRLGRLIYNSEWCRISFLWGGWDYRGGNNIHIRYGRLHAPNEKATMIWNGEECHCWHDFDHALHFLDGRTPEYTSKKLYSHSLIEKYKQSDLGQSLTGKRSQPEWLTRMHATVWEHYGERFFELFDLRLPDLWDRYREFLKEYYDIEGRFPEIKPPLDKVC